jgi:hypothetical protein
MCMECVGIVATVVAALRLYWYHLVSLFQECLLKVFRSPS